MKAILIDFGSTYTKVTLCNLDPPGLIGTAQAPTTPRTDLMEGLQEALAAFSQADLQGITVKRACSSAAGGLKIVAIGLVPALTSKAAREAALGAGARVLATYAFTITGTEIEEIRALRPDLILLAGGTDGGESKTILANATTIAQAGLEVPVVVAGNKMAAVDACARLSGRVPRVVIADNVMPEVDRINPNPARQAIKDLYLEEITRAKGLERIQEHAGLAMPTPLAVMKAGELLQHTCRQDVVVVDVGGATTDIHSFCSGFPTRSGTVYKGLPEPFMKRTVEGDLGVRVSALSLLEVVGEERLLTLIRSGTGVDEMRSYIESVHSELGRLPASSQEKMMDRAMAVICIREAIRRHSGHLTETFTPEGRLWFQEGKDLTDVEMLVGTGGSLIHSEDPTGILKEALTMDDPLTLAPRQPRCYLDQHYILAAVGLLSEVDQEAAGVLLKETLSKTGGCN
jgi:uncharacterized protein (TIGR01319 family)